MREYDHGVLFPDEAFDEETPEPRAARDASLLDQHNIVRGLQQLYEKAGGYGDHFLTTAEELHLATIIQLGLRAERWQKEILATKFPVNSALNDHIAAGTAAREKLFAYNARFAAEIARLSMGIVSDSARARARGNTGYLGTFRDIRGLANSPAASPEDRTQVALLAMWNATTSYGAKLHDSSRKSAKFLTYATWHMQKALEKFVPGEARGWDVSRHVLDLYQKAQHDAAAYGGTKRPITHQMLGGKHIGNRTVMEAGREGVSMGEIEFEAPEESDVFGDSIALTLADIVPDAQAEDPDRSVQLRQSAAAIKNLPLPLTYNEKQVVYLLYGLNGKEPLSTTEAATMLGISKARVSKVHLDTLDRLRVNKHTESVQLLRLLLMSPESTPSMPHALEQVSAAPHIKTTRVLAHKGLRAVPESPEDDLKDYS